METYGLSLALYSFVTMLSADLDILFMNAYAFLTNGRIRHILRFHWMPFTSNYNHLPHEEIGKNLNGDLDRFYLFGERSILSTKPNFSRSE